MDKELYQYLLSLNFEDDDIKFLCAICPGLEIISAERAFENIAIVISYGYPEEDIDGLISANPSFLLNVPEHLNEALAKLGEDIEEKLKNNPDLI